MATFETRGDHYVRLYVKILQQALIMTLIKALGTYHTSYEGPEHSSGQNCMQWYVFSKSPVHVIKILDDHACALESSLHSDWSQSELLVDTYLSCLSSFNTHISLICSVSHNFCLCVFLISACIVRRDWVPAFSLISTIPEPLRILLTHAWLSNSCHITCRWALLISHVNDLWAPAYLSSQLCIMRRDWAPAYPLISTIPEPLRVLLMHSSSMIV